MIDRIYIRVILHLYVNLEIEPVFLMNSRQTRNIGDQMESWTLVKNWRKGAENWVTVILMDQTMYLASCVMVSGDSLMCRVTQLLDNIPGHTTDIQFSLSSLFRVASTMMYSAS